MSQQIYEEQVPEVQEVTHEAAPSVGDLLRRTREARSLQVGDIAHALKLGARQVEALERDDWSALPGTTFIRGFVRNYARLIDVDPVPLMAYLEGQLEKPANTLAVPEAPPARISTASKSRDGLVIGVGGVLLVLAGLAYFLLPNDLSAFRATLQGLIGDTDQVVETSVPPAQEALFPPDASSQQLIAPQVAPLDAAVAPAPLAPPAQAEQAVSVVPAAPAPAATTVAQAEAPVRLTRLRFMLSQASWLEVRDRDDIVLFSQRLPAGGEQEVSGNGPLSVTIGYAPGVSLLAQGRVVDLAPHTRGDVARLQVE
jgi:cytoskeleton protein RodZ